MDTLKQVYLLRMRKACADMEHATQCAACDSKLGHWTCDWNAVVGKASAEFNEAQASLMSIHEWPR